MDVNSSRYTDGAYLQNNPTWDAEHSPWKAAHVLRMLERNNIVPKTVVEIGCGAGEILNQLYSAMNEKTEFVGYDVSPQALALCKPKEKDRLHYLLGDGLHQDKTFDVLMAIDIIEHIEDYFGFLRKVKEKARYKLFHIPLDLSVQWVLRSEPLLVGRKKTGHIHYFTKETALETLKDTGYQINDYFYTAGTVDLSGHTFKSTVLYVPRKISYWVNKDLAVRILGGYSLMVLAQ